MKEEFDKEKERIRREGETRIEELKSENDEQMAAIQ